MSNLQRTINEWSADKGGIEYISLFRTLTYLGENLYYDYEPTLNNHPEYIFRLSKWINNVKTTKTKKELFKLAGKVFYINQAGLNSLHRTAYSSIIKNWIFEQSNLLCNDPNLQNHMIEHMKSVWYTGVSDSMRINGFYKINNIESSHEFKIEWRPIKAMGSDENFSHETVISKWKKYISDKKVQYLVILEDFVGSGKQSSPIVKFVAENFTDIKVLFVPLLICPKGLENIKSLTEKLPNLHIRPVITLPDEAFITWKNNPLDGPTVFEGLQERLIDRVIQGLEIKKQNKLKKFNLGSLIVMYSNTPNNSSPLLHVNTLNWSGLFPRINRSEK